MTKKTALDTIENTEATSWDTLRIEEPPSDAMEGTPVVIEKGWYVCYAYESRPDIGNFYGVETAQEAIDEFSHEFIYSDPFAEDPEVLYEPLELAVWRRIHYLEKDGKVGSADLHGDTQVVPPCKHEWTRPEEDSDSEISMFYDFCEICGMYRKTDVSNLVRID